MMIALLMLLLASPALGNVPCVEREPKNIWYDGTELHFCWIDDNPEGDPYVVELWVENDYYGVFNTATNEVNIPFDQDMVIVTARVRRDLIGSPWSPFGDHVFIRRSFDYNDDCQVDMIDFSFFKEEIQYGLPIWAFFGFRDAYHRGNVCS